MTANSKKIKVLHVAETIRGGVASVLKQHVEYQSKLDGFSVLCLVPKQQVSDLDNCDSAVLRTFDRERRGILSLVILAYQYVKLIIEFKPDVIHLHSSFAGSIGRLFSIVLKPIFKYKVVYCPHAFSFLMHSKSVNKKLYIIIEKFLLLLTDKVICVSRYEFERAVFFGLNKSKLEMIYNGVPLIKGGDFLSPYDVAKTNYVFVGRFDYQKGFDIFTDAIRDVDDVNISFTVIGDFVLDSDSYHLIKKDNITYKGWLDHSEVYPYLMHADALIMTSRWEGFAMVPLEAISFGTPVVSTDSTSLPEVVINDFNGFVFDMNNPAELSVIISKTDKNKWSGMRSNANDLYNKKFTAVEMIKRTLGVYSDLLK